MRKGQGIGIDFAIGTAIFLMIIVISIHILIVSSSVKNPFSAQLRNSAYSTSQKFAQKLSWIVYKIPIIIKSEQNIENQKLGFNFSFSEIDPNSFLILKNGSMIPYKRINYSVFFIANLSKGKNFFNIVYTKNTSLNQISPKPDFNVSNQSEFFSFPLILLSREKYRGLSLNKLTVFQNKTYEEVKEILGLGSLNYNISISGYLEMGLPVPDNQQTYSAILPLKILDRFGNSTRKNLVVSLWM